MQKWEFCHITYLFTESLDGRLNVHYFTPVGVKRDDQSFDKKVNTEKLFDDLVVRLLNEGWEPIGLEQGNNLMLKRIYTGNP
jgi:hypothetical protein